MHTIRAAEKSNKDLISFSRGDPNPELFPIKETWTSFEKIFQEGGESLLSYGPHEGYLPLRQWVAEFYRNVHGVSIDGSDVLITSGGQQGLDLVSKLLIRKDGLVFLERPTYVGALESFFLGEPRFITLDIQNDGIEPKALQLALEEIDDTNPALLYIMPNFQNPTGVCYTEEKCRAIAGLLKGRNIFVVQDDSYSHLKLTERPLLSLKHYLPDQTILIGSFSKIVAPGLRLGWIVSPNSIYNSFIDVKHAADLQSSHLLQRALHGYLVENDIYEHITKLCDAYRRQRDIAAVMAKKYLATYGARFLLPEGGYYLWITLPPAISAETLLDLALAEGVSFSPGRLFYPNEGGENAMRFSFSGVGEGNIEKGVQRLASAFKKIYKSKNVE